MDGEPYRCIVRLLEEKSACWHCGDLTQWVDLDFEAPLCSEECLTAKVHEWAEAYREADRKYGKAMSMD
jgi:endogenous inhibitor of DNA gyrase (YacG/DUF329 family)